MTNPGEIRVSPVNDKAGLKAFIEIAYTLNASDPAWVPPLRTEMREMFDPAKNPFYGHATVQPMIALRGGKVVGRISAHIDHLALKQPVEQGMGPGTGFWGFYEAESADIGNALLAEAEKWLRAKGMTKMLGPVSFAMWDEPGLLIEGHDHPPTVMMGHHRPEYRAWIEDAGYTLAKALMTYELDISVDFPPIIQRVIRSGEKNPRIRIREVVKADFDREAATILAILNDAWSDNWGFVPFTPAEIAYAGKKMRPIIHPELNMIAELDGVPVAFMMTLPDINGVLKRIGGQLLPFGWLHLLRWLKKPMGADMRVPLMGVKRELQNSRLASQLAFMLISRIKRNANRVFNSRRGEIGWILDDNRGMVAIADAIGSTVNREYIIFAKPL